MTASALVRERSGGTRRQLDATARTVLLVSLAALLLVVAVALFAPASEDDPTPATWNTGPAGAKAALLLLSSLGYHAAASEQSLAGFVDKLPGTEAEETTLVLAEPRFPADDAGLKEQRAAVNAFLKHGGTVLATGQAGAALLERMEVRPSAQAFQSLCFTTPEGQSPLARAGAVSLAVPFVWAGEPATNVAVTQRCGNDAVAVRWRVGVGTATWWSSATPLTNLGLRTPANLRLLLASVAPAGSAGAGEKTGEDVGRGLATHAGSRTVLFDESLHGAFSARESNPLQGLPLPLLFAQGALVALLLVFSFSRRHGPVRGLAPSLYGGARTSPIEFALSMGALYSRAEATSAPVEAAERRLYRVLATAAGLPRSVLYGELAIREPVMGEPAAGRPAAIAQALRERFGEQAAWDLLARDLARAAAAAEAKPSAREALAIVRLLDAHAAALPEQISSYRSSRT